jgi:hypothetical protein
MCIVVPLITDLNLTNSVSHVFLPHFYRGTDFQPQAMAGAELYLKFSYFSAFGDQAFRRLKTSG